jgi:oxaloacetate decarboxylase gamma subunit
MQDSLMTQAIELMIAGMGFVFVFLILLVFVTGWMSKIAQKLEPAPAAKPSAPAQASAGKPGMDDATLLAVISAAVNQYRSQHKK